MSNIALTAALLNELAERCAAPGGVWLRRDSLPGANCIARGA